MGTDRPLISVVVITYNQEKYIRKCLEGILSQQTSYPFEVIVGEDCSRDHTKNIVEEFEHNYPNVIKPIYHKKNVGGLRNAYEFCLSKITGKYIAVCEGDDYWTDPHKLEKQVGFLENNPDYILTFHEINVVDQNDNIVTPNPNAEKLTTYTWNELLHITVPTMSMVFRNCINHLPKEFWKTKSGDAFLIGLLASDGRKSANLGFVGAHYRLHPNGVYSGMVKMAQHRQTIHTRRLMRTSLAFSDEHKREIGREIKRRKIFYLKYYLRKYQLINCFRILFT